jgi:hypothetical protein
LGRAMELDWKESESIWSSLAGSEKVLALYGFYPSLHDAKALGIGFDCATRRLEMHFLCEDGTPVRPGAVPVEYSLLKMSWEGVASLDFNFDPVGLRAVGFGREGSLIRTWFGHFYSDGHVLSQSVRVDSAEAVEEGAYDDWACRRVIVR